MESKSILSSNYYKILTLGWSLIILFLTLSPDTGGEKFWLLEKRGMDKVAHFGLFFILSLFNYNALQKDDRSKKTQFLISIVYALFFAFITEFGQQFVQGRSSDLMDFIADLIGSASGIVFSVLVLTEKNKTRLN